MKSVLTREMKSVLTREPILTVAVLQALVALLAAFGLELSPEAQAGIAGLLAAVLALARGTVTPAAKVAEVVDQAATIAATSVACQITPQIAGPAGIVGDAARDVVAGAVALAGAATGKP